MGKRARIRVGVRRAAALFVAAAVGVFGLPAVQAVAQTEEEDRGRQRVLESRTATSETFRNPDGTFTTDVYPVPIHYRDDGAWKPISSDLVEASNADYAWRNEANSFRTLFKPALEDDFLRLDSGGASFALSLEGAGGALARLHGSDAPGVKPSAEPSPSASPEPEPTASPEPSAAPEPSPAEETTPEPATAPDAAPTPGAGGDAESPSPAGGHRPSSPPGKSSKEVPAATPAPAETPAPEDQEAQPEERPTNGLSYRGALPGVDLSYEVVPTGVKELITLSDARAPARFRFLLTPEEGTTVEPLQLEDGAWAFFVAGQAEPAFVIERPWAAESAGGGKLARGSSSEVALDVTKLGDRFAIDLRLDARWLHDPARVFPVTIDPTLTIQPATQDVDFVPTCRTCYVENWEDLWIGGDGSSYYRAALQFDLSGIPAGVTITDAQLRTWFDGTCILSDTCPAHQFDAHAMTAPWNLNSTTTTMAGFETTKFASYSLPAGAAAQWMSWNSTQLVKDWRAGLKANNGILLKRSTESKSTDGIQTYSSEHPKKPIRPKLEVTWSGDGVTLLPPDTLHSNGAELRWTTYTGPSGAAFQRYEVHRSRTATFTPSASTLIATIGDKSVTSYRDTTAAPSSTFTYKVLANSSVSNLQTVTLPAAGLTTKTVQPDALAGKSASISNVGGTTNCLNYGADTALWLGTTSTDVWRSLVSFDLRDVPANATMQEAVLSLWHPGISPSQQVVVDVHRATSAWEEGPGRSTCTGDGATWREADGGVAWRAQGGDFDPVAVASNSIPMQQYPQANKFTVPTTVTQWIKGEVPNHGFLLKLRDESLVANKRLYYLSDDYTLEASLRPQLKLTYADGNEAKGAAVSLSAPAAADKVSGSAVRLAAAATDDGRVDKVEFLVDGVLAGQDTTAPYEVTWSSTSVANGAHTVSARATDDAGNVTTSAAVSVTVENSARPTTAVTSPSTGTTVSGTVNVTADAADDSGLTKVEFYVDGIRIAEDAIAPFSVAWDTLNASQPAYDGTHTLTTRAFDNHGQATTSSPVTVTVANTAGTKYRAGFGSTTVPQEMIHDPAAVTQQTHGVDVTVTNTSNVTWAAADVALHYRWLDPDAPTSVKDGAAASLGTDLAPGASRTLRVSVEPPALGAGVDRAQFRLRFDLKEASTGRWFAAQGNQPLDNPVIVSKALNTALGLERYYHYDGAEAGAGMNHLVNVANGNSLLSWTPFMSPGRGLSTVVDLTYNSLEDHSDSPIGNNFSLAISSLTRLGLPLDVHPNKADEIAGRSNKWIEFTDGDGTKHRFTHNANGGWDEPPGVHLYLRHYSSTDATKKWAITRPDRVTFFFDADGYPTGVEDKNGNRIEFTLEAVPPGEDPGGFDKRVTAITDAAGLGAAAAPNRKFLVDYYSKDEAKKPQIRGKIEKITDHNGSALVFDYYEDGNLLRITQKGGSKADGGPLADRTFVFTYTTSDGSGPAIPVAADRVAPDAKTPNQSTRLYSVRDPRGNETLFEYFGPTSGLDRWKLKSRTDRAGSTTAFAYDINTRTTTVTAPLGRVTKYVYDANGSVTSLVNPKSETTSLVWNADRHVTKITEPTGKFREFAYNANGYVTDQWDQLRNHISLTYDNLPVDAADTSVTWKSGRAIPHLSQLKTLRDARGNPWDLEYDTKGNMLKLIEPEGNPRYYTSYAYNANGTLASVTDARGTATVAAGDFTTTFSNHDANGFAQQMTDAKGQVSTFGFDDDGLLRWVQDAAHSGYSGGDPREYRTYFDYDSFHRLGRQSSPKSTQFERGKLIWSGADYDPNDNLVTDIAPSFVAGGGSKTSSVFDKMDRVELTTEPDISADPAGERTKLVYDAAGRVVSMTSPKGMAIVSGDKDFATFFEYDLLDRVTRETRHQVDGAGAVTKTLHTHFCYDLAGDLVSVTAPKAGLASVTCSTPPGFTTRFGYDAAHRLVSEADPLNHRKSLTYDPNGNVDTVTDEQSTITRLFYDKKDQLEKVVKPVEGGTTPRDATTRYVYDAVGNQIKEISPRAWDASADKTSFTQYVTTRHYDAINQLVKVQLPTSVKYPEQHYVHNDYDPVGNLRWTSLPTTKADPVTVTGGERTDVTYFDPGWVRTTDDPTPAAKINFDYTSEGWQAERWTEGTRDTALQTWTYYPDGMLHIEKDKEGHLTKHTYDANDNLQTLTDESGVRHDSQKPIEMDFAYDGFDRLVKVKDRRLTPTPGNWSVSVFGYDDNGNLDLRIDNREEDGAGTVVKDGRRQEFTYDGADWLDLQFDYGDDPGCSDNQRIDNSWTDTGWEKERIVAHRRSTCATETTTDWQTKQTTTWSYYLNGLLKSLTTKNGAGAVMESHDVSYVDAQGIFVNGHRVKDVFTRKHPVAGTSCSGTTSCTATFEYDARDRLVREETGANKTIAYQLNAAGDVTTETVTSGATSATTTYGYTDNRLTSVTEAGLTSKYWYDVAGNVDCITKSTGLQSDCAVGATVDSDLIADYSFDPLNRLEAYRAYSSGTKTDESSYVYDAFDRVAEQTETHGASKRTTTYNYMGIEDLVTKEIQKDGSGNPITTKTYSYDSYGNRISMSDTKTAETYTYGYDVHGSVSLLLDKAGAAKAAYGYTAYGATDDDLTKESGLTKEQSEDAPLNAYRYSSKRFDSGSGSIDMGARRFGADVSRFLQPDYFNGALDDLNLSLDPLTQNRYALAGGNPISFVEWDGHRVVADGGGGGSKDPKGGRRRHRRGGGGGGSSPADFRRADSESMRQYRASNSPARHQMRQGDPRALAEAEIERQIQQGINSSEKAVGLADDIIGAGRDVSKRASAAGRGTRAGSSTAAKRLSEFSRSRAGTSIARTFKRPGFGVARGVLGPAGFGLSFVSNMSEDDQGAGTALVETTMETAGSMAGAKIGFMAGCAVGGPVGCAVGALAGGIAGGIGGSLAGDTWGDDIADAIDSWF